MMNKLQYLMELHCVILFDKIVVTKSLYSSPKKPVTSVADGHVFKTFLGGQSFGRNFL